MHSTQIIFALALFHGDPAVWQYPFMLVFTAFAQLFAEVHPSAWTFYHREIFECAHSNFMVSGQSKQTSIDTHMR